MREGTAGDAARTGVGSPGSAWWDAERAGVALAGRRPVDRLFAFYAIVSGAALIFPSRPAVWPVLATLHLAAIVLALRPAIVVDLVGGMGERLAVAARTLHAWYPLLLVPALYAELAPLNLAVHAGAYFDPWITAMEEVLFRGQPSRSWSAAVPRLALSEPLHAAYLSYYLIIFGPPLLLYLRGRVQAFDRVVFTIMLAFFAHYVFFIYFPVQGPRYLFPAPGGSLADGPIYQLTHRVLEGGSSQGAAFPSSHVGVAVAQTALAARLLPRLFPILLVLTVGVAAGAVYGGFHYATDVLAGLLLGLLSVGVAPLLARRLGGRTGGGPP